MQPTCRQVPPRYGSFSTTIVFSPSSPARIAATYPPGPLPIIATSYFATLNLPSVGTHSWVRNYRRDRFARGLVFDSGIAVRSPGHFGGCCAQPPLPVPEGADATNSKFYQPQCAVANDCSLKRKTLGPATRPRRPNQRQL